MVGEAAEPPGRGWEASPGAEAEPPALGAFSSSTSGLPSNDLSPWQDAHGRNGLLGESPQSSLAQLALSLAVGSPVESPGQGPQPRKDTQSQGSLPVGSGMDKGGLDDWRQVIVFLSRNISKQASFPVVSARCRECLIWWKRVGG